MAGSNKSIKPKLFIGETEENAEPQVVPFVLVKRGEDRVLQVNSVARDLQLRLETAARQDLLSGDVAHSEIPKHFFAGMLGMCAIAVAGWSTILFVASALL